jgi:hypothetical protein
MLEIVVKHANILLKPDVELASGGACLADGMRPAEQKVIRATVE